MRSVLTLMFALFAQTVIAAPLAGSEWKPEGGGKAFVRFEADGRAVGNGGCNGFFANYKASGKNLKFGPIGSTRKLCSPATMKGERAFLKMLQNTARFERKGTKLRLMNVIGVVVGALRQTDWD